MQISCERCSTSYVLDDALIPPQGAPVQCTRCGLVFTAKPAGADPSTAQTNPHTNTAMFGAIGSGPAPKHSTAMFGAVGATGGMFDALKDAKPNQTLMFGGSAQQAPAKPPSTALFGALGSGAPGQPSANSTLIFGGSPAAAPEAPKPSPSSTMVFGAVPSPAAPAPAKPAASSTMVFGALGSAAPGQPPAKLNPSSTMIFGGSPAATTQPEAPRPSPSSTMMFGAVGSQPAPAAPPPTQPAPAKPSMSSTMMFGAVGSQPAPAPAQPAPAKASASSTMMFGAVGSLPAQPAPAQPAPAKSSMSSTMMFGAVGSQPAPAQPAPAKPSMSSTMMFGAVGSQPAPAQPEGPKPSSTLMFGAPATGTPAWQAPPPSEPGFSPQPQSPAEPAPAPRPKSPARAVTAPVGSLPGAPVPFPQPAQFAAVSETSAEDEALAQKLAGRSKRLVGGVVGALALVGLAAGGYWFTHRPKPIPPELQQKAAELFRNLELDTPASLQTAQREYTRLQAVSPPEFPVPAADELIAIAFQAADVRAQAVSLQAEFTALEAAHKKADGDRARADWRTLVNDLVDRMRTVKAKLDPLQDEATKLDQEQSVLLRELSDARAKLDPAPPELDRALGIYYALKGSAENAERFSKSYRARVANDGWADLILAASANQSRQTTQVLTDGLAAARSALKANPRLTRAKRIEAELQLALRDVASARATAAELSLDPDDPRLKVLLSNIEAAEKAKAANP